MTAACRVEVLGGPGTVCRDGAVVAWFAPGFPSVVAGEVLELARSLSTGEGAAVSGSGPAARLAKLLEGAVPSAAEGAPPFAVVIETDGAHSVVLQGHVVVSEDGVERLRGTNATGLGLADLPTASSLTVRGGSDPDQLDRPGSLPFDLRAGTVPGGGITFWGSDSPQPSVPPELDEHVVLFDLSVPATPREPLPVAQLPVSVLSEPQEETEAPPAEPATPSPAAGTEAATPPPAQPPAQPSAPPSVPAPEVTALAPSEPEPSVHAEAVHSESAHQDMVRGITCARGHFNNPRALYCGICGLAMVQNSIILVDGPRPPLGVLLSDAGMAYSLDADYILGRAPELTEDVASGRARPLKVDDGTGKISRVHARVTLHDWDVVITDLGSHNGTSVFNPGATSWRTLRADEPFVLLPGGRLVIGQSTFEFQSIQRQ
jgi:hypothetical protein